MGNNNCLFYYNLNNNLKKTILNKFKNNNITGISFLYDHDYFIIVNNSQIYFRNQLEILQFVNELNRPFTFKVRQSETITYQIDFTYGIQTC